MSSINAGKTPSLVVVVVLLCLIVAGVVAGLLTGYLYAGAKSPEEKVVRRRVVCGKSDIASYNSSLSQRSSDWGGLAKSITTKKNYASDPTCEYILFQYALRSGDKPLAAAALSSIKKLNQDGQYADGSLDGLVGIGQLDSLQVMYNSKDHTSAEVGGEG